MASKLDFEHLNGWFVGLAPSLAKKPFDFSNILSFA
jgi:hypothetical protein